MISAPDKVNAFISTIFQIARNYNFTRENFYLASLRSYQELYLNYFEKLEAEAEATLRHHQLPSTGGVTKNILEEILSEQYAFSVDYETLASENRMPLVKSIFIDGKAKILILDPNISDTQKAFLLAKELAYQHLQIVERPKTFTWIHYHSFEEVLNNFRASYFAGALLIPKGSFEEELRKFFRLKKWNPGRLASLLQQFTGKAQEVSAETFFQRLTNLLPGSFGMERLFFLRFEGEQGEDFYSLTKELHLSRQHQPHGSYSEEHYCRRWISLDILKQPEKYQHGDLEIGVQRSSYINTDSEYLVISIRQPDPFKPNFYRSISVGIEVSAKLKKQVAFLNDPAITKRQVSVTCEYCPLKGCEERAVPATRLQTEEQNDEIEKKVNAIVKAYQ
ncbi:MAG: ImmA/IrrE family metallo-endopeptidase [Owenweeksia sp.]|nr:ImmA/IrrE family metallo-endopeptidase [Owenweeksia sp.]